MSIHNIPLPSPQLFPTSRERQHLTHCIGDNAIQSVRVVVTNERGDVLVGLPVASKNVVGREAKPELLGGKYDNPNEHPFDVAKREIFEEAHITITPSTTTVVEAYTIPSSNREGKHAGKHIIQYGVVASLMSGTPTPSEEHSKVWWEPPSRILNNPEGYRRATDIVLSLSGITRCL